MIGGGPGGISAAYYLRLMGHDVTIYEQRKQLGGMLRYGIPSYRLPRETLDREIEQLLSTGIHVKTGVTVGESPNILELRSQYDAVYIAIGAHTDRKIGIEGEDAEGVISAVELLRGIGDSQLPDFTGKDIIVIGGGNVAMDVARSAIRLGAKRLRIAYRRRREDMTAMRASRASAHRGGRGRKGGGPLGEAADHRACGERKAQAYGFRAAGGAPGLRYGAGGYRTGHRVQEF